MRKPGRTLGWVLLAAAMLTPASVRAQSRVLQNVPVIPIEEPNPDPRPTALDTGVSFIDSALPMRMGRLRFDANWYNRRPTRAEYYQAKGGIPGSPGPRKPEMRLDLYEMETYAEHTILPNLSIFFASPFRSVDPQINGRSTGVSDVNLGLKWAFQPTQKLTTTLQLRGWIPTAAERDLGTEHFSVEPALLAHWRVFDFLVLEGEARYWYPVDGTDFAGDVVRYGIGVTYGQRSSSEINICPVVELVGWTVLDGKAMVVTSPGVFFVEDSSGDTIVNLNMGVRVNLGNWADFYTGYGRCLTGAAWFEDIWRLEFRVFY